MFAGHAACREPGPAAEVSVAPRGRITRELAAEFAAAGVRPLVLLASPEPDGPARAIEDGLAAVSGL